MDRGVCVYCEDLKEGLEKWATRDKIIKVHTCRQRETGNPLRQERETWYPTLMGSVVQQRREQMEGNRGDWLAEHPGACYNKQTGNGEADRRQDGQGWGGWTVRADLRDMGWQRTLAGRTGKSLWCGCQLRSGAQFVKIQWAAHSRCCVCMFYFDLKMEWEPGG